MFLGWTVKQEPGRWKLNCQPSEATTAWQYWGASSSLLVGARRGTTVETLPVTCCTDTTRATTSGPGYCSIHTEEYTEDADFDHLNSSTTKLGGHVSRSPPSSSHYLFFHFMI